MLSHDRLRPTSAALGGWLVALAVLLGGCSEPRPEQIRAGGVTAFRVTRLGPHAPSRQLDARPGDWVLRSRVAQVVIGGLARSPEERGAVLSFRRGSASAEESELRVAPSVLVGSRRVRVLVTELYALERGGRPVVRLVGDVQSARGDKYQYARELTLSARESVVGIGSTLVRLEGEREVRLGARIEWGGRDPFVGGIGELTDESPHEVPFLGVESDESGIAFAERDAATRVTAHFDRHGSTRFLERTEAFGATKTLRARGVARDRALLVVAPRGLGEAVRRLGWFRGAHYPEAVVRFSYEPPHAYAHVTSHDGRPIIDVRPGDAGIAVVPLAEMGSAAGRDYVAVGAARGHADSEPSSLREGAIARVDIPRGGRVRVVVLDGQTGTALPSRARFIPVTRGIAVDLGPDWSAAGARDAVVMHDGEALVPLVPGRYRVLVTHGPEWSSYEETVDVTETFRPDVRASLRHVVDPGDYVPCDLHVHQAPSPDSQVSLEDRVASLVAEGIVFAVPTDHNHVTDYGPASASFGFDSSTFMTVPGVEATTADPAFGHFNAYPATPIPSAPGEGAPVWSKTTPSALFAAMRALSPTAVVQVNHPRLEGGIGFFDASGYDPATGRATGEYSDDFDALEIWNGFDLARASAFDRVFGDYLLMVARGVHVTAVGNSDSHEIRYEWPGYPRTYVRARERTEAAVVEGIRGGHAFVTSGPFLDVRVDEAGPGDLAHAAGGSVEVRVHVECAPFMRVDHLEVWMNAAKAIDVPLVANPEPRRRERASDPPRATRYDVRVALPVSADTAIVVLVRGERTLDDYFGRAMIPPLAVANPIWIDADGDGVGPVDPRPSRLAVGVDASVPRDGAPRD